MSLKSSEIHNCSWSISTVLESPLISSSSCCQAYFPPTVRPMNRLWELILKIFLHSPELNGSIFFSMHLLWMTKKIHHFLRYFKIGKQYFTDSESVQVLFPKGTVLGEEPAGATYFGFDRLWPTAFPTLATTYFGHSQKFSRVRRGIGGVARGNGGGEGRGGQGWGAEGVAEMVGNQKGGGPNPEKGRGQEGWGTFSHPHFNSFFLSLWRSSRGILVVFWSVETSNVLVFAWPRPTLATVSRAFSRVRREMRGVGRGNGGGEGGSKVGGAEGWGPKGGGGAKGWSKCATSPATCRPPGFDRTAWGRKQAHLRSRPTKTPPKFHEKTPGERKKEWKWEWEKEKKARNFWRSGGERSGAKIGPNWPSFLLWPKSAWPWPK